MPTSLTGTAKGRLLRHLHLEPPRRHPHRQVPRLAIAREAPLGPSWTDTPKTKTSYSLYEVASVSNLDQATYTLPMPFNPQPVLGPRVHHRGRLRRLHPFQPHDRLRGREQRLRRRSCHTQQVQRQRGHIHWGNPQRYPGRRASRVHLHRHMHPSRRHLLLHQGQRDGPRQRQLEQHREAARRRQFPVTTAGALLTAQSWKNQDSGPAAAAIMPTR